MLMIRVTNIMNSTIRSITVMIKNIINTTMIQNTWTSITTKKWIRNVRSSAKVQSRVRNPGKNIVGNGRISTMIGGMNPTDHGGSSGEMIN